MSRKLVLGWQVSGGLDPRYWLRAGAVAGSQPDGEIVTIAPEDLAHHTAIIAQSGSGKSFFLGRLVEEIILSTRSRCIVFDPNADFRRIHETEEESLWSKASYDPIRRLGRLPHEKDRSDFYVRWDKVAKCIFTNPHEASRRNTPYKPLRVPLTSLSVEFITGDLGPNFRAQVEHCHIFVTALADILAVLYQITGESRNLLEEAEALLATGLDPRNRREFDKKLDGFSVPSIKDDLIRDGRFPFLSSDIPNEWKQDLASTIVSQARKRMESSLRYTNVAAVDFYFARARQYEGSQLLYPVIGEYDYTLDEQWRLGIVDLPSMPERTIRQLAVNALLKEEWQRAQRNWSTALGGSLQEDNRVPTFIVVDEAHNLIPASPGSREESIIREQFRTIAAEGRKYGIFLIIISQRPDKVDPIVLGECQNKAILRLSSSPVVESTRALLNLDEVPRHMLERTLSFDAGRVLISGPWAAEKPVIFYSCARRTIEGGRNLRSEFWARPEEDAEDGGES